MSQVKVIVVENRIYGSLTDKDTLQEAINWFETLKASVPIEHREKARVDISIEYGYEDSATPILTVFYFRDETDQERTTREGNEKLNRDKEIQHMEARLARLKAEYSQK